MTCSPSCVPGLRPRPQCNCDRKLGGDHGSSWLSRALAILTGFVIRLGAQDVTCRIRKRDDQHLPTDEQADQGKSAENRSCDKARLAATAIGHVFWRSWAALPQY